MTNPTIDPPAMSILVVDDSRDNLQLLAKVLSSQGYTVRPANDSALALVSAQTNPPDLILLDIMLPGRDGYAVCEALKADPRTHDIPVIFISAMRESFDKVRAFAIGGVDYITKPFDTEEVLARVGTHLALRRAQRQLQEQNVRLEREIAERKQAEEALRESEARFRRLFDQSPVGASIASLNFQFLRVNEALCHITGYSEAELLVLRLPDFTHPDDLALDLELAQQLVTGQIEQYSLDKRYIRKDGSIAWINLSVRLIWDATGQPQYFLPVIVDITERKQAEAALHRYVEDLTILNQVSRVAATITDLKAIPQTIAEFITALFNASSTTISTFNRKRGSRRVVAWHSVTASLLESLVGQNYPLGLDPVELQLLETKRSVLITDPQSSLLLSELTRQTLQQDQIHCLLLTPLLARGEVTGYLSLASARPDYIFTLDEIRLAETVAVQIAGAIETACLFNREQRQRHLAEQHRAVAESLGDILALLNSNRPLPETLDYIAAQTNHLLGSDANAIFELDADGSATLLAAHGIPSQELARSSLTHEQIGLRQAAAVRHPVVSDQSERLTETETWTLPYPTLLAVPLLLKEVVYGGLILYFAQPRMFSKETMELAMTFGHQVALALENAHLRDQVREIAVAEERNRLARDLHDAVTQILFSANLIAAALPQLWEDNPQEAQHNLDKLRLLMQGALAEMRTLLLELRPKTLVETKLSVLLTYLADALTSRTRIPANITIAGDGVLPPEVQLVVYRIAQECLNNIGKHAQASQVNLDLHFQPDKMMLRVSDDGCGFEPEALASGHLGIGIMHERAKAIGAALQLVSQPGAGTQVVLTWPDLEEPTGTSGNSTDNL